MGAAIAPEKPVIDPLRVFAEDVTGSKLIELLQRLAVLERQAGLDDPAQDGRRTGLAGHVIIPRRRGSSALPTA